MRRLVVILALICACVLASCGSAKTAKTGSSVSTGTIADSGSTTAAITPTMSATVAMAAPSPTPRPSPTPSPTVAPMPTTSPTSKPASSVKNLADLLPALADMPPGFALDTDAPQTAATIASSYATPSAEQARLQVWGFKRAYERDFELPSMGVNDLLSRMIYFTSTVGEFGSAKQAQAAAQSNHDYVLKVPGAALKDVSATQLGDRIWASAGTIDDGSGTKATTAFIWVTSGPYVLEFRGAGEGYNPFTDVMNIATKVMQRDADQL